MSIIWKMYNKIYYFYRKDRYKFQLKYTLISALSNINNILCHELNKTHLFSHLLICFCIWKMLRIVISENWSSNQYYNVPSKFSIISILFNAKLRYSSFFNLPTFSVRNKLKFSGNFEAKKSKQNKL